MIWAALALAIAVPIAAAVASPLLAWRDPVYIAGGFAGIIAMAVLLMQIPGQRRVRQLLAAGFLPGLAAPRGRRVHRWTGTALFGAVIFHVAGLWITSPPDVIDVLLFRSPTPFAVWGVIAMWAVFAAASLAAMRRNLRYRTWARAHSALAVVIVVGSVVHALLIEGTMEVMSKAALCGLIVLATGASLVKIYRSKKAPI